MQEIQSLILRVQRLGQDVDWWNTAMIVAVIVAALAAAAVVVTTRMALVKAKELTDTQGELEKAKDRNLQETLRQKDVEISRLNKTAEKERLARVKIEERLGGWKLEPKGQAELASKLKPFAKTPFDLSVNPSEARFMETLNRILVTAGWAWQMPKPVASPIPNAASIAVLVHDKASINTAAGIRIELAQGRMKDLEGAAAALVAGLIAKGIPAKAVMLTEDANPTAVHIVIGSRE